MHTKLSAASGVALAFLLGGALAHAQKIPGMDEITNHLDKVSVQKLFEGQPPITTTLTDAVTEVTFLDDFEPSDWGPLGRQPREAEGQFRLRGGAYFMETESYCLRAGSYAPGAGDGYLYAPLKGPRAKVVHNVLARAYGRPQVEQRQVQSLVWAILARTKVSDMSGDLLLTAKEMLTPSEIYEVNGGALGVVPPQILDEALREASPAVAPVLEAEAKLRSLMSKGDSTYEQYERAAVLVGKAPLGPGSREVPRGRWSFHPAGYFVRYVPHSYPTTAVWVYTPERFTIETDGSGAVTSLAGPAGWRLVVEYAEERPAALRGHRGFAALRLRSLTMERILETPRLVVPVETWRGQGWVALENATEGLAGDAAEPPGVTGRLRHAELHRADVERLRRATSVAPPASVLQRVTALAHLRMALRDVAAGPGAAVSVEAVEFVTRAWMSEVGRTLAKRPPRTGPAVTSFSREVWPHAHPRRSDRITLASWIVPVAATSQAEVSDEDYYFTDLSDGAGQPGNTSGQREGISNKGTKRDDTCAGEYAACKDLAQRDFWSAAADCIESPGKDRECTRQVGRDFRRELQNCATIAKHCFGF